MFSCPECHCSMTKDRGPYGVFWRCPTCNGRTATISLLRRYIPRPVVNKLWQTARTNILPRKRVCPACEHMMAEVPILTAQSEIHLDVCTVCQVVWFDPGEHETLPTIPRKETIDDKLSQEVREKIAILELDKVREQSRGSDWGQSTLADHPSWHWIPGLMGMPVEQESSFIERAPLATWIISAIILTVSIASFTNLQEVVQNYGLIPAEPFRHGGLTFLTSFLLHGGIFHLISNLYFFLVFGDNVEDWLGSLRFCLLLACATVAGDLMHIALDPRSTIPLVGASGGISGVIAYYALTFPRARFGYLFCIIPFFFRWLRMPAYGLFGIWLLLQFFGVWQQMGGFSHVSALAHLGGASVGVIFWAFTRKK